MLKDIAGSTDRLCAMYKPISDSIASFVQNISRNPELVKYISDYADDPVGTESVVWARVAENGWFPNWFTPLSFTDALIGQEDIDELDSYMTDQINGDLLEIEQKLVALHPERTHIFKSAFQLHRENNFIAAIPLFLSQSDGVCAQSIKAFLFTDNDKLVSNIGKLTADVKDEIGSVFYVPLLTKTQFGASIGKYSATKKALAPNRSGILHGSRKHLDYGTSINSLKAISLLAYCATIFDEDYK